MLLRVAGLLLGQLRPPCGPGEFVGRLRQGVRGLDQDHVEVQRCDGLRIIVRHPAPDRGTPVAALHEITGIAEQFGHQAMNDLSSPARADREGGAPREGIAGKRRHDDVVTIGDQGGD